MNNYETVFILTPVLSEAQIKETVDKFTEQLKNSNAQIVNEENWGLKKLAYPIEKKSTGFYFMIEFEADPSVIKPFETSMRRDERILRYITVKQDKFAKAYAEKRRSLKSNSQNTATAAQ